jgi:hypothetical protein
MSTSSTALLMAGLLLSAAGLSADVIPVNNPSFENTTGISFVSCGTGCAFSTTGVPQWTSSTTATGLFQPSPSQFSFLPDGITTAYSNGGTISQTVGATVQAGLIYTLTVFLGQRFDLPGTGFQSTANLLLSGPGGSVVVPATGSTPAPGSWSQFTAKFVGSATTAGDSITIQLGAAGIQGNFDDVQLSVIPEPGSIVLLGLGFAGLLAIACLNPRRWAAWTGGRRA